MKPKETEKRLRRTMVALPDDLWKAAHIRAMEEDVFLRDIVVRALEAYLKTPKGKR